MRVRARHELLPARGAGQRATPTRLDGARDVPLVFAGYGLVGAVVGLRRLRRPGRQGQGRGDLQPRAAGAQHRQPPERRAADAQTTLEAKAAAARDRGARLLIVVGDPTHRIDQADYSCSRRTPTPRTTDIPVLRVRRTEAQALIDAFGSMRVARQIDGDLVPRSRAAARRHDQLHRAPVEEPPHGPQRRRRAAGQRPRPARAGHRHRRALRPRRPRRPLLGDARSAPGEIHNGADDNASGTSADHRDGARGGGRPRAVSALARVRRVRRRGARAAGLGALHDRAADADRRHRRDAQPRHGGPRRAATWTSAASSVSPSMEAGPQGGGARTVSGLEHQARGPGRGPQRRFVVPRPAHAGDQLLHRLPRRLPSPERRLGADRRQGTSQVATLALELAASLDSRHEPEFVPEFVQR